MQRKRKFIRVTYLNRPIKGNLPPFTVSQSRVQRNGATFWRLVRRTGGVQR